MSDDSGEMVASAYVLGLPHPPGYPLFTLVGHLFSWLPIGTVAFRFNLLSSLFVLLGLVFLGLAEEEWEKKAGWVTVAMTALVLLAVFSCRSVFAQALTAKGCVYTLTFLFLTLFWWLRVRYRGKGISSKLLLGIGFLWGLGLANHWESELLWVPFLGLWIWQENRQFGLKQALQAGTFVVFGLSLYLYLPLRTSLDPASAWGHPTTLREFWWVVSREAYRGLEPMTRSGMVYGAFVLEYLKIMGVYWLPGFCLLSIWGPIILWRKDRDLFYSSLGFYMPVVMAIILVPREETKFLLTVYLLATQGLVAWWAFVALKEIKETTKKWTLPLLGLLVFATLLWTGWVFHLEDKSRYTAASDFALNAVKTLPAHSVFLVESDIYAMPLIYEREVEGKRKDLVFVLSTFLFHDWGWDQLTAQDAKVARAVGSIHELPPRFEALAAFGKERPLFVDLKEVGGPWQSRLKGQWYPWMLEQRWTDRVVPAQEVILSFDARAPLMRRRDMEESIDPSDVTTREIEDFYAQQYFDSGWWLSEKKDFDDALVLFDRGRALDPSANSFYGPMAIMAAEKGFLKLARRLNRLAIENNPYNFGSYINLVHVYILLGDDTQARFYLEQGLDKNDENPDLSSELKGNMRKHWEMSWAQMHQQYRPMADKSPENYAMLATWFDRQGATFLAEQTRTAVTEKEP